jgi:multicomponent K+:H+ antiporter subunit C
VISFGMTAVVVMLALGSFLSSRDDTVNIGSETPPEQPAQENEA